MKEGALKTWLFRVAANRRVIAIVRNWASGVPILAYHGVTAREGSPLGNLRRLHIPARCFEEHLRILAAECQPISLLDLVDAIEARRRLPARSVVLTFDDGYRNVFTVARPLLRKYSIPATLFVATRHHRRMWEDEIEVALEHAAVESVRWNGAEYPLRSVEDRRRAATAISLALERVGPSRERGVELLLGELGATSFPADDDRDLLTWEEIDAVRAEGIEIGSHADRHGPLTERPLAEVKSALVDSRQELERRFGPGRYALAYPYGARSAEISAAARAAGFCCALITRPGLNRPSADLFGLRRFLIGADDDEHRLRASLSGLRAFWPGSRAGGLS